MTATASWRGHAVMFDETRKTWVYSDDGTSVADTWQERPCGHCGEHATAKGHDACIANLPGVMNACCGHGDPIDAYVQFRDGREPLKGREAIEFQREYRT